MRRDKTARFLVFENLLWRHIAPSMITTLTHGVVVVFLYCSRPLLQPATSHGAAIIPCCSQNYPVVRQLSLATARIIPWCCLLSMPLSGLFRAAVGGVLQRVTPCCCQNYPIRLPTCPRVACDGLHCECWMCLLLPPCQPNWCCCRPTWCSCQPTSC